VPDAGGLVIATDQQNARDYAELLTSLTGKPVTLVLSDDPKSSSRIGEFAASDDEWMVAVRMVSEGVDVPRLAVGVYATNASTPLYFAQAIGRFVRSRRPGETASVFLPSVPVLLQLAAELEAQRDHVLGKPHREESGLDDALLNEANKREDEDGEDEPAFQSLHASAELDQVIYDGASFGTATDVGSDEESDYLGLPGLLDADQVRTLLQQRQAQQVSTRSTARPRDDEQAKQAPNPAERSAGENLHALRKELNTLVALHHHRTGRPHGQVHNELRERLGGPPTAMATAEQLRERIAALRTWK